MGIDVKKAARYAVVFFLSIGMLALIAPSLTAKAQQVTYGVYPGDSFTYGTPNGSPWVQTYPSGSPPLARWEQFVNCSTLTFTIINYSNPNSPSEPGYTFKETLTLRNGSAPINMIGYVDLYYGAGVGESFFISPWLENDSYVYPGAAKAGNFTWAINSTRVDQLYWPGVPVCELNCTSYTPYENSSSPLIATQTTFYWDQQTGVLLGAFEEAYGVDQSSGASLGGVLLYELIANNIHIPMNYGSFDMTPIYFASAIGGVAVIGVVILQAQSSKSKKKYKQDKIHAANRTIEKQHPS
jgi:hypothetical protein